MSEVINPSAKRRYGLRSRFLSLTGSVLALIMTASCGLLPEEPVYEQAPVIQAYTQSPYEYTLVRRGDIEIRENVRFEYVPTQEAALSFPVGGLLFQGIYVKQGSQVKAGQILAELEAGDVDQMFADAKDGIDRLELEKAQLIERQMLERKRLKLSLEAQGMSASEIAAELKAFDESRAAELKQIEDQLYISRLALEQMEITAGERRIYAPFDATVAYVREKKSTDRSTAHETMIRLAVSESSMFVGKTKSPEFFEAGMEMFISVDDDEIPVVAVDPVTEGLIEAGEENNDEDNNGKAGETEVYLRINADHLVLESGTKGNISLLLDASRETLLISEEALHFTEDQSFVYVESADGLREVKYIEIGLENGKEVEVLSGLEEGERIILD